MAIMEVKDYSFRYAGETEQAIKNISFALKKGEVVLVAGDSGSGKTTFLKSLNGLIPAITEGEFEGSRIIAGKDYENTEIYDISRTIGSVFQNPRSQFFTMNSTSEMAFAMENYGFDRSKMKERIYEINNQIPIEKIMDRDIYSLSSGERQLLALSASMTLDPDILIFDEPSANLDYGNAMRLRRIIKKLQKEGKIILVADHRFFYMKGITDRVFLIRNNTLEIFESEKSFRNSDYDTRSFDLFEQGASFGYVHECGKEAARLESVSITPILSDVSLTLYENETAALIGINGAGKTTIAKLLTKSLKPESGKVEIDHTPFYVMQDADYQLFGTSVENELELGNTNIEEEQKRAALEKLGILKYRDTHPFDLSGGEKQRLQIAVATLSRSKTVIFDEPTSGLDVKSMELVVNEINRLRTSKSVLVISHDYEFIRKVSDRIIFVKDGRIAKDFKLNKDTLEELNDIFRSMEEENEE